jgi:hypothetical protein
MILEVCWDGHWTLSFGLSQSHGHGSWLVCEVALRAALYLKAGPIPLEADCMKFQPLLGGGWPQLHITIRF